MGVTQLKQALRKLSLKQLRKLDAWLHELIQELEKAARAKANTARPRVCEERIVDAKTYRRESVRCGKANCRCAGGKLHGPDWYAYWTEQGKTMSQYIGKQPPPRP